MDKSLESILEDALRDLDDEQTPASTRQSNQGSGSAKNVPGNKMAFDPLGGKGPRRKVKVQQQPAEIKDEASSSMRPDVNELWNSLTGLLEESGACEASTGTPSPSSGNAGLPDIKATLDALDAASKQAMGGQQAEGKPPPVDGADPENSLIEAVMRKLLSKEILYDPLLEIKEQYPEWFKSNAEKMSETELEPYRRQHDFINQICSVYESDPSNYEELIRLFQEVQACGQPPPEIVCAVAPELNPLEGASPQGLPLPGAQECLQQ